MNAIKDLFKFKVDEQVPKNQIILKDDKGKIVGKILNINSNNLEDIDHGFNKTGIRFNKTMV